MRRQVVERVRQVLQVPEQCLRRSLAQPRSIQPHQGTGTMQEYC